MSELDDLENKITALLAQEPSLPETNQVLLRIAHANLNAIRRDQEQFELAKQALVASVKLTHELNELLSKGELVWQAKRSGE